MSKSWVKTFLLDTAVNFCIYMVCYLLWIIIALYAMRRLGTSASEAGFISGIFILGGLVGRIAGGRLISRVGSKKILYFGLVFYFFTTLLYLVSHTAVILFIVRFFHGVSFGLASTSTGTIVAEAVPREVSGQGIGYYALSVTLASAIGPFVSLHLLQDGDFPVIIIICSVLILIAVAASFFLKTPPEKLVSESKGAAKGFRLSDYFEAKALPISAVTLGVGICYSVILSFMASYTQSAGLSNAAKFFFVVYAAFTLISRPFTGRLLDRKGDNYVIYPALALFSAGLACVGAAHAGYVLLAGAALVGLGYGTFTSSAQTIAVKASSYSRMSLATSTYFGFLDAGTGGGPFILGFMITLLGYRELYFIAAAGVILCMGLYWLLHGRRADGEI